jgi:hypothetical protein
MAGKKHKEKGDRAERWVVEELKALGLYAQRVPLSGAAEGEFGGDIRFGMPGEFASRWSAEVKSREEGRGWAQVRNWLGYNHCLFLKEDRLDPLVVMPWERFKAIISNLLILKNSVSNSPGRDILLKANG